MPSGAHHDGELVPTVPRVIAGQTVLGQDLDSLGHPVTKPGAGSAHHDPVATVERLKKQVAEGGAVRPGVRVEEALPRRSPGLMPCLRSQAKTALPVLLRGATPGRSAAPRGGVITGLGPVLPGTEIVRGANDRAVRVGQPELTARGAGLEVVGSAEGGAGWARDFSSLGVTSAQTTRLTTTATARIRASSTRFIGRPTTRRAPWWHRRTWNQALEGSVAAHAIPVHERIDGLPDDFSRAQQLDGGPDIGCHQKTPDFQFACWCAVLGSGVAHHSSTGSHPLLGGNVGYLKGGAAPFGIGGGHVCGAWVLGQPSPR